MKRGALLGAALALLAAAFAVSATAGLKPPPQKQGASFSPVYVSIADGAAVEGQTGALKLNVVKPLLPKQGITTHIYYKTISGGTAMLGTDYVSQTGTVYLAAGQASGDVVVSSLDDIIYQPDHTFKVQIWSTDPWVVITRNTATFTIHDNDKQPTAWLKDPVPNWTYEGGSLTWTLVLSNPSYQPVTVHLDGGKNIWTTLLPADYDGSIPTSVTIPPYGTSAMFTIHTHDNITQSYKVMWIWMTGVTNGFLPAYDYGDVADQLDCWGYGSVWDDAT